MYQAPVTQILCATTANQAAGTSYYPDSTGVDVRGRTCHQIKVVTSGGVVTTLEIINDMETTPTWLDVTKSALDLTTNLSDSASYSDVTALLQLNGVLATRLRVKSVRADSSNSVAYSYLGV